MPRRIDRSLTGGETKDATVTVVMPVSILVRVDSYIKSPVSEARTRKALFELAILEYLEREEPIVELLEAERTKIRNKILKV